MPAGAANRVPRLPWPGWQFFLFCALSCVAVFLANEGVQAQAPAFRFRKSLELNCFYRKVNLMQGQIENWHCGERM